MIGVLWVTSLQYMHIFLQLLPQGLTTWKVKLLTYVTLRFLRLCLVNRNDLFWRFLCRISLATIKNALNTPYLKKVPVFPSARYFLIGSATSEEQFGKNFCCKIYVPASWRETRLNWMWSWLFWWCPLWFWYRLDEFWWILTTFHLTFNFLVMLLSYLGSQKWIMLRPRMKNPRRNEEKDSVDAMETTAKPVAKQSAECLSCIAIYWRPWSLLCLFSCWLLFGVHSGSASCVLPEHTVIPHTW